MPKLRTLYHSEQRARRAAEQTADRLGRLQAVTAALSQAVTAEEVADVMLTQGLLALEAACGIVAVWNTERSEFTCLRSVGYPQGVRYTGRCFAADARIPIAEAVRKQQPVILEGLQQWDAQDLDHTWIDGEGSRGALVALPLIHGQLVGGLEVRFAAHRAFREADHTFLQTLAGVCAQALERARLYDAERDAREHLQREIEERQRAEAAVRDSEERYRRIVETSAEGIWVIDAESCTTFVNQRMAEMLGCHPQDMLGGYPNDFLFAEDLEDARQKFRRKRQGDDQPFDFRLRRRDGSAIWVRVANRPLYKDNGQFVGVLGMFSDITERRQLEEALRQSEQHYRALANSVPDFIFTCAPDGRCDYCNQRWCDYTGLTVEQTRDSGWRSAVHPDDAGRSIDQLQEAFYRGQPFEFEYRIRKSDGSYRWFLNRLVPWKDERGQVVKWFAICTDIDSHRRLEEALQEADRRKDEFLALLAHELRHPLAAIQNAVQAAKLLDRADTRLQWAAEVINRQVQHLSRLVDDLLDVSRITRGKVALQKQPVELTEVVTRAVETVRPLLEARKQELTVALLPKPLWLEADAMRLVQVLGNLLVNATRYTQAGGHIWLTAATDRKEVILCVRDTGIGIAAELLPRIFDPFIQGDRSAAHSEGGLGIGLTLVKSLLELHGGSVHASSAGLGKGSEFVVRLPILQFQASGPAITTPPE